jgi:ketosteroid isomerase-like protein
MAEENAEVLARAVDAYNRRDVEALLNELDPAIEWLPAVPGLFVEGGHSYRGHDGIRQMLRDFADVLDEVHFDYDEIRDLGERVVAIGSVRVRGKASGLETESPYACVGEIRGGRGVRLQGYLDPDEALAAAGLGEGS